MAQSRFQFVAFILVIVAVFTIGLSACAGSKAPTETGTFTLQATPINATITLPAGAPVTAENLTIWSSGSTTTPNSQNQTRVTIFNNGPQYVDARDNQGRLVLAGYLGHNQTTLNAESTAETLIFFAIGGAVQIGGGAATVLAEVKDISAFGDVVDAVQDQLTSQGFISVESGTLNTLLNQIIASYSSPPAPSRGTVAEPTFASGLFLDTSVDGQLKIQNNHLRRAKAWLQAISYEDQSGSTVEVNGPITKFDIAPPSRYGGFTGNLVGIITGNLVWTPTISESIAIPLSPANARSTTYKLTTFGLGANQGNPINRTPEQTDELVNIQFKSLVLDAILPVLANIILPLNGEAVDEFLKFSNSSPIISDMINIGRETLPQVVDKLQSRDFRGALQLTWDTGFTSNTALPAVFQAAFAFAEQYGSDALTKNLGNTSEKVASRLSLLGYVDIFYSAADMAIFINDFNKSNDIDTFTITTTGGKVTLNPEKAFGCGSDQVLINAVIQDKDPNAVYRYQWSVSDNFVLSSATSTTTNSPNGILTTNEDFVSISQLQKRAEKAKVTCIVTRIDGEPDRPVDTDVLEFEFIQAPTFTPESATVAPGGDVTITGAYAGSQPHLWKYTLTSPTLGSINRTAAGSNPSVTFTAGTTLGNATIKAELVFTIGGQQITACEKTLNVRIGDPNALTVQSSSRVVSTPNALFQPPNNIRHYGQVHYWVTVPVVPGATTYFIKRNGEPFKSFTAAAGPNNSATFTFGYGGGGGEGIDVQIISGVGGGTLGFETPGEAQSWIDLALSVNNNIQSQNSYTFTTAP